ncbi:MAG TPA: transketolase [Elusimicrobia bacterium]|jgi:transketolase|nr:transketolase [Elusimicrobiota bacterium]
MNKKLFKYLEEKVLFVRKETLKIHKTSSEIRIASCLSDIEIFVVLYYGKILKFKHRNITWKERDMLIVSKGHGAVSLYPILADLGFFDKTELITVCNDGAKFGSIPDCSIPGFETISGSLGHGLGIGCGVALALKKKKINSEVFVVLGDGELFEGSVWEAVMFAQQHHLDNLLLIIDNNKISMLDYCKNTIDLTPLDEKFKVFNWEVRNANGHNVEELHNVLTELKEHKKNKPKVVIADTVKGKGIPKLENDPLCHIRYLTPEEIDKLLGELK